MWPSDLTNNHGKDVAGTTVPFVVAIPCTFQSIFPDILLNLCKYFFKIVNDTYVRYMFPIWFLPPNKPKKFPQITELYIGFL